MGRTQGAIHSSGGAVAASGSGAGIAASDAARQSPGADGNTAHYGPPRAVFPPPFEDMAAMTASAAGFELSGAPDRPFPQRLPFEAGGSAGANAAGNDLAFPVPGAAAAKSTASEAPATLPRPEEISDLKPLGQVRNSFIVAINGEGLWIIDQHVAHERVLFEQHLRARRAGAIGGQRLLMPLIVELTPRQLAIFDQIEEELRANGFEAQHMGGRSVAIQAAPAGIAGGDAEKLLNEILDGAGRESQAVSMETLQGQIAASTACHAAIKVNMALDRTKMEWLLAELARTEYPMSCPHGRPVVLRYSLRDIERAFKRI